ncbi:peptidyl-prolyl cis-trans isomerase [Aureococcus anophagefferens]|jgi:peptidylprolyl isomerase|uniref:Peptidyl-prolyl cis-trans isomerase n=2 Tax=Aureococcus anophagefferens TaxID=44056 RepID=A0ABR1G8E9_AURAN|nr:peptidyl-prolyl cis-trans isomerase [Aureococcus anophagefferens]
MSYGMRAKPKQGGAVDRQRLTPLTTGARQTPLYGNKGIGGQDDTGLRKHTKKGLQYDDRRVDQGESPMRPDLEAKLQLENSVTTLLLEGGEADWKYEITPYVPGECHPVVFFDMAISGDPVGRIEMTLRDDVCPETCENFRCLCTGERGDLVRGSSRQHLWYKGCRFHRVIPDFMAQGGDITRNNGSGGHSIYGKKFADENFELKFDKAGALAMANGGKNTNSSQFFIALQPCEWLDGKHTVFGFVSAGMDVVRMIEDCGTAQGRTRGIVTIAQCGQLQ